MHLAHHCVAHTIFPTTKLEGVSLRWRCRLLRGRVFLIRLGRGRDITTRCVSFCKGDRAPLGRMDIVRPHEFCQDFIFEVQTRLQLVVGADVPHLVSCPILEKVDSPAVPVESRMPCTGDIWFGVRSFTRRHGVLARPPLLDAAVKHTNVC